MVQTQITGSQVEIKPEKINRSTKTYGWTRRDALATMLVVALVVPVILIIVLAVVYGLPSKASSSSIASSSFIPPPISSVNVNTNGSFISQCTAAGQSLQTTWTYFLNGTQVTLGYPDILFTMTGPSSITCINLPIFLRPQTASPVVINNLNGFDNSLAITTARMTISNSLSLSSGSIEITNNGALFAGGSSIGGVTGNTLVYSIV